MNPPHSPFNPAAPVFRPPLRQHQDSPPRRPFHEATTPQPPQTSGNNDHDATPTTLDQPNSLASSIPVSQRDPRGNDNESLSGHPSTTTVSQRDARGNENESLGRPTSNTGVSQRNTRGIANESLRRRISQLEEDRSVKLEGFQKACEAIGEARASLEYLSQLPNFDSFEDHYRTMQSDLREMEQYRVEYGDAFETIGYELDKLYAELVVG
ncbi:MAG: hypothetical protein Q9191_003027 [Dirinaria sp. TL-2023a]